MTQGAIRFSDTTDKRIRYATKRHGFSSPTAFIRYAAEQELSGQKEKLVTAGATGRQHRPGKGGSLVLGRSHQALFALVDCLAKILLTSTPEPDIHVLEGAARAQGRHARLLKSTGQAMGADSRLAMQELVKHGER